MSAIILFTLLGYISGSVLYAQRFGALLGRGDVTENTADGNPGAFNAFKNGGALCGTLTLVCDILKGLLPVLLYLRLFPRTAGFALVLAAPVIGHILPVFNHFRGGKGIAVSFGCLLGLLPDWRPVAVLAVCFLFFSLILRVEPHYHRTLLTYLCSCMGMALLVPDKSVVLGFSLAAAAIVVKLLISPEKREKCVVTPIWRS